MTGEKHASTQFDAELDTITAHILEMGRTCLAQMAAALEAMARFDSKLANDVLEREQLVNSMEVELDRELFSTIARRQPTARDLRLLLAVSKTAANLERVGDEAARIARIAQRMIGAGGWPRLHPVLAGLAHEAELATGQLGQTLDALERLDAVAALKVLKNDRVIDREFEALLHTLVTFMMEDPSTISACIDLIFAARAIERVGDHAKNVAEQVIYIVKGADVRHNALDAIEPLVR